MARSIRSTPLETRTARLKLPVAKKPVFVKIGDGLHLGYRRNQTAGAWVVRILNGGDRTKAIGAADDFEEANGVAVFTFWQAQEKARVLAQESRGDALVSAELITVAQALDSYKDDLQTRAGDVANAARVCVHLTPALSRERVATLTTRDLRGWRDALAKKLAPATVNRTTTALKAALNLAADQDERITTRRPWEIGLATLLGADETRNVILTDDIVRAAVAAAGSQSAEFGMLVEVAAVTGARVSQLAKIAVSDLQADRPDPRLMMPVSRKGKGAKKVSHRPVPISAKLAARLVKLAEERAPAAPLLTKPSGEPWKKSDHSRLFARAARQAGLDPKEVTIYALRHSSIVRQLLANVPVRVVAVNHDTSVAMIERTYSAHIADHADALARGALLDAAE